MGLEAEDTVEYKLIMNGNKMKLLKLTIKPKSLFATPLQGDTIFGQICWNIRYLYSEEKLEKILKDYEKEPFLIVSDGFRSGYLPKPKFPKKILGETDLTKKKEYRKKIWLKIDDFFSAKFENAKKDDEVAFKKVFAEVKNSINYKTFTTGENFAPFVNEVIEYLNEVDIYFLIQNYEKEILEAFETLGKIGYGKDSSTGKGRFEIVKKEDVTKYLKPSNIYMALSAFSLKNVEENVYYDTFVKFPKSRGDLKNPFKNPIVLASTGTGIQSDKHLKYIGKAITNFANDSKIVHQGYAITLPIGVKNEKV